MTRLAIVTPLPPSTSGIAQYSAELLPLLARIGDITIVLDDDAPPPDRLPFPATIRLTADWLLVETTCDLIIYQIGNNPEHAYALTLAERTPGICVLHDVVLQHLQVWRALQQGEESAARYRAEMATRYGTDGDAAAEALLHNRLPDVPYAAIPLYERVIERSLATIVHNDYARDAILRLLPGANVTVVPHGVPILPEGDRTAARQQFGFPSEAFVIASLGNLIPEKRLEIALAAYAQALFNLPEALFVIAGSATPHYTPRTFARTHGLEPVTRWPGRVTSQSFEALLVAADLCINLRWPTGGETSGSLLRMLAAGRPTIVSDAGSFAALPDDACIKAPVGEGEREAIARAILRAAHDRAWASAIGARARAFVAGAHALERAAAGYHAVIEGVLRTA